MNTPTEAKLNSLFAEFQSKLSASIEELVPQLTKESITTMHDNVKEAVTSALPSYSDMVTGNMKTAQSTKFQFVVKSLIETEPTYFEQTVKDSTDVSDLVQYMCLQAGGNILSIRKLGKIPQHHNDNIPSSQRRCRLILVTISNSFFLENCFASSNYSQY